MNIRTLEEWQEIADKGTSGDMVMDILASWAFNKHNLEVRISKLEERISECEDTLDEAWS